MPPTAAAHRLRWLLSIGGIVAACLFLLLLPGHNHNEQLMVPPAPLWIGVQVVRVVVVVGVSIWLGWYAQWHPPTLTEQRVGHIITTLCSIGLLAFSTFMWLDAGLYESVVSVLAYVTLLLGLAQLWWIAHYGYVRFAASLCLVGCLLVVLGTLVQPGVLHQMTALLGYTLLILVGGLLVRWWVGVVLAVALPLMHTALQFVHFIPSTVNREWTAALIILLSAIAGIVALYTRSLERALQLSDLHAEQLRAAQTELEQVIAHQEARIAQATAQLTYQAYHDPLTGLCNRARFMQHLHATVAQERAQPAVLAVLFLDLDGFKHVNDTLGHDAGDALLVVVAQRVQACVRDHDTVARLGGDEFTVLLDDVTTESVLAVAERITAALSNPVVFRDRTVQVSSSIGIAISHAGEHTVEELLRQADVAMYHAKQQGKARYAVFDLLMDAGVGAAATNAFVA